MPSFQHSGAVLPLVDTGQPISVLVSSSLCINTERRFQQRQRQPRNGRTVTECWKLGIIHVNVTVAVSAMHDHTAC